MTKQLQVWNFILQNLRQDIPVILLYVVDSIGSSPGRRGFFMAVNARHIMKGSIGGGIMEHKFVEMAKELLRQSSTQHNDGIVKRQVHDKAASKDQSGMICSGEQTIVLYAVQNTDLDAIQKINDCLHKYEKGTLKLLPGKILFENKIPGERYRFEKNDTGWQYEEVIGISDNIHIVGGGHCALALSKIMRIMGFYVRVYDDRPMLNTMLQNESAHEKILVAHYDELKEIIKSDEHAYAVIMTLGYRSDDIALRALIEKKFKYLGVLGSNRKIEKMFSEYRAEGWSEAILASLHAPVGLNIKSESPEEIAISIAAEIIKVKNHAHQDR
jgi:xanthine dehydrogenase accessory factor